MSTSGRVTLQALAVVLSASGCAEFPWSKCETAGCTEDARIRAEVEKQLNDRPSLRIFSIQAPTHDHVVYLEGLVDTRSDQRRAEEIAMAVSGVRKVYDELGLLGNGW